MSLRLYSGVNNNAYNFIEITKVFDTVNHRFHSINCGILDSRYLKHRSHIVKVKEAFSSPVLITYDVPQGLVFIVLNLL